MLFIKLCARWVPKQLTPEHKAKRMESELIFLQRYHDDSDEFLDRIITGDETWVAHFTPETKQQSVHWRQLGGVNHSSYSPDLAPSDFHLFLHLKKFLSGQRQRFQNDREAEMSATQWFHSQAAYFYDTRI